MSECNCESNKKSIKYLWFIVFVLFMDSCVGCFPPTVHRNNDIADAKSDIQYLTKQMQQVRDRDKEEYDIRLRSLRNRIYSLENSKVK